MTGAFTDRFGLGSFTTEEEVDYAIDNKNPFSTFIFSPLWETAY